MFFQFSRLMSFHFLKAVNAMSRKIPHEFAPFNSGLICVNIKESDVLFLHPRVMFLISVIAIFPDKCKSNPPAKVLSRHTAPFRTTFFIPLTLTNMTAGILPNLNSSSTTATLSPTLQPYSQKTTKTDSTLTS